MTNRIEALTRALPLTPPAGCVRLAHTADNHLRLSAGGSTDRGADFKDAFLDVVTKSHERGCHALISAGDLVDRVELSARVAQDLLAVLKRAEDLGLRTFTVQGNHDMAATNPWPKVLGSHLSRVTALDGLTVDFSPVAGLPPMRITGWSFCNPDSMRQQLSGLRLAKSSDVLIWHGPVAELANFQGDHVNLTDFEDLGTAAVLLGDIHKTAYVEVKGSGVLGYPGSTELCNRQDPLTHTFTLIDLAYGPTGWTVMGMELVPVNSRPSKVLRLDDEAQVAKALVEVRAWAEVNHRPGQVFITYSSDLQNVRAMFLEAAGHGSIVRAQSFDRAVMNTVKALDGSGELPKIESYMSSKVQGAWASNLALSLAVMPVGSNYGPALQTACDVYRSS